MTDTQTANIDEVLNKLAEILHGASAQSQQPSTTEPVSSQVPLQGDPEQTMKLREQIATEMMYMQMVPPLTEEKLIKLDEFFAKFPDLLKSLDNRPYLQSQIDKIVASGIQTSEISGGRTFDSDPELEALVQRMGQDISGDSGERFVLLVAVIGALAAGVAIGQALR